MEVYCPRCNKTLNGSTKEAEINQCPHCNLAFYGNTLPFNENTSEHPEQVAMVGGKAASSKIPALHLIPRICLEKTADRFALGIQRKGEKSWNAVSNNQEILLDKEFLIDRMGHIVHHAYKLIEKLAAGDMNAIEDDDDASAIVWGGMYAQASVAKLLAEHSKEGSFPERKSCVEID